MIAAIVTGRPARTDFEQVDEARWIINFDNYQSIKHVTILLPQPLPISPGMLAAVYITPSSVEAWQYMGFVSNDSPSVTFRVSPPSDTNAGLIVGVSIEPEAAVQEAEQQKCASLSYVDNAVLNRVGNALMKNIHNFLASFAVPIPPRDGTYIEPGEYIPLSALERWNNHVERRIRHNAHFWEEAAPDAQ